MKLLRRFGIVVFACMFASLPAVAGDAPEAEFKTSSVAAFKNGLAFVLKQGDVRLDAGSGRITPIPNATLGSLWIAPNDPGTALDEVVAYRYKVPSMQPLTRLADVLVANTGKLVTVVDGSQKEYTGEIVGLQPSEPALVAEGSQPQPRPLPEFLLLKSEGKLLALNIHSVVRVSLPSDPILQQRQEEERRALRFRIRGAASHANLTVGYLTRGLGWTPSYLVSLTDDKTAQITMQAVMINDAEDLNDADVSFVVGVPNFGYASTPSPMALQQSLLDFMQSSMRKDERSRDYMSNAILSQKSAGFAEVSAAAPSLQAMVTELQGSSEEDLFMYSRKGVTLARGERATYNIFSASVGYEHVYEWEIQEPLRVDGRGNPQNYGDSSDRAQLNNVWHSLRLKNSTKFPWTSAPAMVVSGVNPLAQDTLTYTPKGAPSNLKLTIATDIRTSHEEREVERQSNVVRRYGYNYDQVTIEGKVKVKNYKAKEVHLNISRTARGAVEPLGDNGKSEKLAEGIAVDNPLSHLTWEVNLKPGEERTITYRYKVWLRV
jgi:hypothetical protein